MGINMSTYGELIANTKTVEEIRVHLGADSLGYLSLESMRRAVGETGTQRHCAACFSGDYPADIEDMANEALVAQREQAIEHSKTPLFAEAPVAISYEGDGNGNDSQSHTDTTMTVDTNLKADSNSPVRKRKKRAVA